MLKIKDIVRVRRKGSLCNNHATCICYVGKLGVVKKLYPNGAVAVRYIEKHEGLLGKYCSGFSENDLKLYNRIIEDLILQDINENELFRKNIKRDLEK